MRRAFGTLSRYPLHEGPYSRLDADPICAARRCHNKDTEKSVIPSILGISGEGGGKKVYSFSAGAGVFFRAKH